MHLYGLDTIKKFSGTILGCGVMLLASLPNHNGFVVLFCLLFLVPLGLYSVHRMVYHREERRVRLIKCVVWLSGVIMIIGYHYYLHVQTRDAANSIAREILAYKKKENLFPASLDALSGNVSEVAGKYHIRYYGKDGKVYLYYHATFIAFDTYSYNFQTNRWNYEAH